MNIITKNIEELRPAKYNPRKALKSNSPQYRQIKKSIDTFGYVSPIIINSDNTVIGGHQRLKVLKDCGYKTVECVVVNLDKEEEKALNLALNKIKGEWDEDKLETVLFDLHNADFDIDVTGFDIKSLDFDIDIDQDDKEPQEVEKKPNERIKTIEAYNLDLFDFFDCDGFYEMPIIHKEDIIPTDIIGFNYMLTTKDTNCGVHMFVDDYQFERIWNSPDKYIDRLKEFECVFSPDFSLYLDMPMAMKVWNVYRSRMIGQYLQRNGVHVIPTVSWAEESTFRFCFDGIEEGCVVATSTIGVKRNDFAFDIWKSGMDEMIRKIKPSAIIHYGGKVDYDYKGAKVIYFENKVTERMKNSGDVI